MLYRIITALVFLIANAYSMESRITLIISPTPKKAVSSDLDDNDENDLSRVAILEELARTRSYPISYMIEEAQEKSPSPRKNRTLLQTALVNAAQKNNNHNTQK